MKKLSFLQKNSDRPVKVDANRVLANDVTLPGEGNPGKTKLWLLSSVYGPMAVVWANSMDDAVDIAADEDLLAGVTVDDDAEEEEHHLSVGNHGDVRIDPNELHIEALPVKDQPLSTLLAFAEARGRGEDTLDW